MTEPAGGDAPASDQLVGDVDLAERHLGRVETTASLYALLFGGVVLGIPVAITQLPLPVGPAAVAWAGVVAFGIAGALLAGAARPSLTMRSAHPYGIVRYATVAVEQIPAEVEDAHTTWTMSVRLSTASFTAVRKYRWIRRAENVAWLGAGLLACAWLLALAGAT